MKGNTHGVSPSAQWAAVANQPLPMYTAPQKWKPVFDWKEHWRNMKVEIHSAVVWKLRNDSFYSELMLMQFILINRYWTQLCLVWHTSYFASSSTRFVISFVACSSLKLYFKKLIQIKNSIQTWWGHSPSSASSPLRMKGTEFFLGGNRVAVDKATSSRMGQGTIHVYWK